MTDMSDISNDRSGILSLSTIYEVITFHAAVVCGLNTWNISWFVSNDNNVQPIQNSFGFQSKVIYMINFIFPHCKVTEFQFSVLYYDFLRTSQVAC